MHSTKIIKAYNNLYEAISNTGTDVPEGWHTTAALQRHWGYATLRASSARAYDYYAKGLLLRKEFKKKTIDKGCRAYAFYPSTKYASLEECDNAYKNYSVDNIPAGWVSVRELKNKFNVSKSCVHDYIERYNLDYRIYKAANKLGGYTAMMFIKLDKFKKIYEQRS